MNKVLLLIAFIAASCGKNNSDSPAPIPTFQKAEEILERQDTNVQVEYSGLVEAIQLIITDVNLGKVGKTQGLNKIAELIGAEQFQNIGEESIFKIAQAMTLIHGNAAQNLEILLGLQAATSTIKDEDLTIESLFMALTHEGFDHPIAIDRVLISYISLLKSTFNNQINDAPIYSYFMKRFHSLRQTKGMSTDDFLVHYSMLSELLSPEKVFRLFNGELETLVINNEHTYAARKVFATLLSQKLLNSQNMNFNKTLFDSAANNALWAINSMGDEFSTIHFSASIINDYFSLFDRVAGMDLKDQWIEAVDYRSEVIAYKLSQKLEEKFKRGVRIEKLLFNKNHPYYDLYLTKALLLNNLETPVNNLEVFQGDFYKKLANYNKGIELQSNYLTYYYDVEIKRQFLSFKRVDKEERVAAYDSLLTSLISALNERTGNYELTLEKLRNAKERKSISHSLALGNSSSLDERKTFLKNYCLIPSCTKTTFKAGIYTVPFSDIENKNIEIYAQDIRFTPLAMIYAPGGNVLISAKNMEDLWIDTSGLNGVMVGFSEEENKTQYPEANCSTRDYHFGKNTKNGKIKTCKLTKEVVSPQDQPQGNEDMYNLQVNGKNAGKITLNMHYDGQIEGLPLFVSRGGSGANGMKGLKAAPEGKACLESFVFEIGELKTFELSYYQPNNRGGHMTMRRTERKDEIKKQTFYITKSRGGKGGDAGNGATPLFQVPTEEYISRLNNTITEAGMPGIGGEAGDCGKGDAKAFKGVDGEEGETL